jgi:hypothetical protein
MTEHPNMWHLVKAELSYRKVRIACSLSILVGFCILRSVLYLSGWGGATRDIPSHLNVLILWTFVLNGFLPYSIFSGAKVEKRDVLLAPLPVSPRDIILSRMLTVGLIHAFALIMWLLMLGAIGSVDAWGYQGGIVVDTNPRTLIEGTIWTVPSMLAISLYFSLLIMLAHSAEKATWVNVLLWIGALLFSGFFVYPVGSSPEIFLPGFEAYTTLWGALYLGALVAGLAYLNFIMFLRKRSYAY